jgi:hypothetical protein
MTRLKAEMARWEAVISDAKTKDDRKENDVQGDAEAVAAINDADTKDDDAQGDVEDVAGDTAEEGTDNEEDAEAEAAHTEETAEGAEEDVEVDAADDQQPPRKKNRPDDSGMFDIDEDTWNQVAISAMKTRSARRPHAT